MGGYKLEIFKFAICIFIPIGMMTFLDGSHSLYSKRDESFPTTKEELIEYSRKQRIKRNIKILSTFVI